jgi:hypothetical protein
LAIDLGKIAKPLTDPSCQRFSSFLASARRQQLKSLQILDLQSKHNHHLLARQ